MIPLGRTIRRWAIACCAVGMAARVAPAAAVSPPGGASPAAVSRAAVSPPTLDQQPLEGNAPAPGVAEPSSSAPSAAPFSSTRMLVGLGAVLVLIFLLKWLGQNVLGQGGASKPSASVRVLGRTPLAPKQQVLLLQVGRRVLVVADSHGRMNALCEIAEPDEVASLVGTTRSSNESAERINRFGSALRRAAEPFGLELPGGEADSDEPGHNPDRPETPDVNNLLDRVREMRQQFKSA